MNTIANFQIFSPIPFRQYNPNVTQTNKFEVNKNSGHFDPEEYSYISFYGKDYVSGNYPNKKKRCYLYFLYFSKEKVSENNTNR